MNSLEFLAWLERMGWSDAEAAAQLRVDRARVFRWRKPQHAGGRAVPPYMYKFILDLTDGRNWPLAIRPMR